MIQKVLDFIIIIMAAAAYISDVFWVKRDGVTLLFIICFIIVTIGFIPAMYRTIRWMIRGFR